MSETESSPQLEYLKRFRECPTASSVTIVQGEGVITRGDLMGCRIIVTYRNNQITVSHYGPESNDDSISSTDRDGHNTELPGRVDVYSLDRNDYLNGSWWRPMPLKKYELKGTELVDTLRRKYPNAVISNGFYHLDASIVVDFMAQEPVIGELRKGSSIIKPISTT